MFQALKTIFLPLFLTVSWSSSLLAQGFGNQTFSNSIKSVSLQREKQVQIGAALTIPPYLLLGEKHGLTLRFDELNGEFKNYSFTVVHCNPDWTASDLFPNEYLDGFTEDNITDYTFSQNTVQEYIHYYQQFPTENMKISKSGNYTLIVYESGNRDKVLLTQRFFVVDSRTNIIPLPSFSNSSNQQKEAHQINFKVNVSAINSSDPLNEFKTIVVQNMNLDEALHCTPAFINNEILSFFGTNMNMQAGNNFRQIDLRGLRESTRGIGVYQTFFEVPQYHTILNPVSDRKLESFTTYNDFNGKYYPMTTGSRDPNYETDYAWVYFYYDPSTPDTSLDLYVFGQLSDWGRNNDFKMKYSSKSVQYVAKSFLKEGVYDYAILENAVNQGLIWSSVEGNFYQTENSYSIFVYYKSFTSNYFQLIGNKNFLYR